MDMLLSSFESDSPQSQQQHEHLWQQYDKANNFGWTANNSASAFLPTHTHTHDMTIEQDDSEDGLIPSAAFASEPIHEHAHAVPLPLTLPLSAPSVAAPSKRRSGGSSATLSPPSVCVSPLLLLSSRYGLAFSCDSSAAALQPLRMSSERELESELTALAATLRDVTSSEWNNRTAAMHRIAAITMGGAASFEAVWADMLRTAIRPGIAAQLGDLRSLVVRDATALLALLSVQLPNAAAALGEHIEALLPQLLRLNSVSILVIATAAHQCMLCVLQAAAPLPARCAALLLESARTATHSLVRSRSAEYVLAWLTSLRTASDVSSAGAAAAAAALERVNAAVEEMLRRQVSDKEPGVRVMVRRCYWVWAEMVGEARSTKVWTAYDARTHKLIHDERKNATATAYTARETRTPGSIASVQPASSGSVSARIGSAPARRSVGGKISSTVQHSASAAAAISAPTTFADRPASAVTLTTPAPEAGATNDGAAHKLKAIRLSMGSTAAAESIESRNKENTINSAVVIPAAPRRSPSAAQESASRTDRAFPGAPATSRMPTNKTTSALAAQIGRRQTGPIRAEHTPAVSATMGCAKRIVSAVMPVASLPLDELAVASTMATVAAVMPAQMSSRLVGLLAKVQQPARVAADAAQSSIATDALASSTVTTVAQFESSSADMNSVVEEKCSPPDSELSAPTTAVMSVASTPLAGAALAQSADFRAQLDAEIEAAFSSKGNGNATVRRRHSANSAALHSKAVAETAFQTSASTLAASLAAAQAAAANRARRSSYGDRRVQAGTDSTAVAPTAASKPAVRAPTITDVQSKLQLLTSRKARLSLGATPRDSSAVQSRNSTGGAAAPSTAPARSSTLSELLERAKDQTWTAKIDALSQITALLDSTAGAGSGIGAHVDKVVQLLLERMNDPHHRVVASTLQALMALLQLHHCGVEQLRSQLDRLFVELFTQLIRSNTGSSQRGGSNGSSSGSEKSNVSASVSGVLTRLSTAFAPDALLLSLVRVFDHHSSARLRLAVIEFCCYLIPHATAANALGNGTATTSASSHSAGAQLLRALASRVAPLLCERRDARLRQQAIQLVKLLSVANLPVLCHTLHALSPTVLRGVREAMEKDLPNFDSLMSMHSRLQQPSTHTQMQMLVQDQHPSIAPGASIASAPMEKQSDQPSGGNASVSVPALSSEVVELAEAVPVASASLVYTPTLVQPSVLAAVPAPQQQVLVVPQASLLPLPLHDPISAADISRVLHEWRAYDSSVSGAAGVPMLLDSLKTFQKLLSRHYLPEGSGSGSVTALAATAPLALALPRVLLALLDVMEHRSSFAARSAAAELLTLLTSATPLQSRVAEAARTCDEAMLLRAVLQLGRDAALAAATTSATEQADAASCYKKAGEALGRLCALLPAALVWNVLHTSLDVQLPQLCSAATDATTTATTSANSLALLPLTAFCLQLLSGALQRLSVDELMSAASPPVTASRLLASCALLSPCVQSSHVLLRQRAVSCYVALWMMLVDLTSSTSDETSSTSKSACHAMLNEQLQRLPTSALNIVRIYISREQENRRTVAATTNGDSSA